MVVNFHVCAKSSGRASSALNCRYILKVGTEIENDVERYRTVYLVLNIPHGRT
ncbi:rCG56370 [Rattus norvegicus]|uniref:RCG56370 n=1 Tax=Rattus norvegicus TaxID=10116 RepID=A6IAQ8_RAT|nr:rCG56370 [Rattus norvegicus]